MAEDETKDAYVKAKIELQELRRRMEFSNLKVLSARGEVVEKYCSFCGKPQNEVKTLIEGPAIYICNICVRLCQDILDARDD